MGWVCGEGEELNDMKWLVSGLLVLSVLIICETD